MPILYMGETIRAMRIRMGYTQEELADGICTTATLSKIENGKTPLSRQMCERFMERLCGIYPCYVSLETEDELMLYNLSRSILVHLEKRNVQLVFKELKKYQRLMNEQQIFQRQFYEYTYTIYLRFMGESERVLLERFLYALRLTMPKMELSYLLNHGVEQLGLLSYDEINIMENIGICLANLGNLEEGYSILQYLMNYIRKRKMDMVEYSKMYPTLLGNYAWIAMQMRRYDECIEACSKACRICWISDRISLVPYLLRMKTKCLWMTENRKAARMCMEQLKMLFQITEDTKGYSGVEDFFYASEPVYVVCY